MRYKPYTEEEIQSMNVMDEGTYPFQVLEVTTTNKMNQPMVDKNGNEMAKLKLLVWDKQNHERPIFTFISGDGNFAYKLRHFAKTVGMLEDYEQGIFNIHRTIGRNGTAHIVIKKGTLKDDGSGEMWADRNDVKDFVCDATTKVNSAPQHLQPTKSAIHPNDLGITNDLDDDIPFN